MNKIEKRFLDTVRAHNKECFSQKAQDEGVRSSFFEEDIDEKETRDKKFSIVVPIYNTEKYLSECIESLINQTYKNIEIILVNDGSPGNAMEICKKYLQIDNRIKYIDQKNQGAAIARNNGISVSSGDYVFCADSDDTIEPMFIEKVVKVFEESDSDYVIIGRDFYQRPLEVIGSLPTCGGAIKKDVLNKYSDVRFQDHIQPCEDGLFTHKILALIDKVSYCNDAVYYYRKHEESSEHNLNLQKLLRDIPQWLSILEEFYNKYNLWDTKQLHLLAFIYNEPYGRFQKAGFSSKERKYLFDLIHKFIEKHNLNEGSLLQSFNKEYRRFVQSNSYGLYQAQRLLRYCSQMIFSVKNIIEDENKIKVLTILGLKIKLKEAKLYEKQGKKLLLIGSNLVNGQGGVEHVLCNMANEMSHNGVNVVIATMENQKGDTFYRLNNNVKFTNVYEKISLFRKIERICVTKKIRYLINLSHRNRIWNKFISIEQPDIIICFSLPLLLDVTYKKDFKIPIILTVHGNPINDYSNRFILRSDYENDLLKLSYQKADVIQVLLDSYKSTIPDSFTGEVVTIPNISPNFDNSTIDYDKVGQKKIVCIASLDDRKHQDLLIKSFSVIAGQYNDWIVELWGSGYKREQYKQLIKDLKMEERIFLRGSTKEVYNVLKDTDIFALPSTCEGWPLVLGEAMSLGIPCIGLSDCDGVKEIIKHRINGVLSADKEEDFTEQLKFLMDHKNERKQYGMQAKNDMKYNSEQIVWGQWKDLIFKYLRNTK